MPFAFPPAGAMLCNMHALVPLLTRDSPFSATSASRTPTATFCAPCTLPVFATACSRTLCRPQTWRCSTARMPSSSSTRCVCLPPVKCCASRHQPNVTQVSPHVSAPLARVARNRGVNEEAYTQVSDGGCPLRRCAFLICFGRAAHRCGDRRTRGQGADLFARM